MTASDPHTCFYCGVEVSGNGRGDRFPIPAARVAGERISCCASCHDMKDRLPLDRWPAEWLAKVIEDLPKMSRETRIFLAKSAFLYTDDLRAEEKRRSAAAPLPW